MCLSLLEAAGLSLLQVSRAHILNKATEYIRQLQKGGSVREVSATVGVTYRDLDVYNTIHVATPILDRSGNFLPL